MKAIKLALVLGSVALLLVALGALQATATPGFSLSSAPNAPTSGALSLANVAVPASSGNTFTVDLNVSYTEDDASPKGFGAYEGDINFDPALMSFSSRTAETVWNTTPPRYAISLGPKTDIAGVVAFGAATCGHLGANGKPCTDQEATIPSPLPAPNLGPTPLNNALLSRVTFQVPPLARGRTTMSVSNAQITNIDAVTVAVTTGNLTVGVASYSLTRTTPSALDVFGMSIPVTTSIANAQQLRDYLGGFGAGVRQIFGWNKTNQQFLTYNAQLNTGNFTIARGDGLFVRMATHPATTALFAGTWGPQRFNLERPIGTGCKYSFISLPLDSTITDARGVRNSMGGSSKVQRIVGWDKENQFFRTYNAQLDSGNFAIQKGDPIAVCVTATGPAQWP